MTTLSVGLSDGDVALRAHALCELRLSCRRLGAAAAAVHSGLACIAHAFDTFARCSDPEKQVPATLFGTPMRNTVNEGLLPKAS